MYAVIDTETSGLFNFALPADAEGQPRLAHLAMIFVDAYLQEETVVDLLVKPEGWTMPPEVAAINHLPNELLLRRDLPVRTCLKALTTPFVADVLSWPSTPNTTPRSCEASCAARAWMIVLSGRLISVSCERLPTSARFRKRTGRA